MRQRSVAAISAVMYVLCFINFCVLFGAEWFVSSWTHFLKFITAVLILILGFFTGSLRCAAIESEERRHEVMRRTARILLWIYIFTVIDFTLVDKDFGRHVIDIFHRNSEQVKAYLQSNTNNIPFATIVLYIRGFADGNLTFLQMIENLFGNFAFLVPFALLLPVLYRKMNRFGWFLLVIVLVAILIEMMQLLLLCGSSDVDDVLLNVSGACAAFFVFRSRKISAWLLRKTYGIWHLEQGGNNAKEKV